jgi:hypothetical protein
MSDYSKLIIDSTNPADISSKVTNEKETRKKLMTVAKWAGREKDMLLLFVKFDKLLRECGDNEDKKKDVSKIGAISAYKLLGECFASLKQSGAIEIAGLDSHTGELYIDGELIYRDK